MSSDGETTDVFSNGKIRYLQKGKLWMSSHEEPFDIEDVLHVSVYLKAYYVDLRLFQCSGSTSKKTLIGGGQHDGASQCVADAHRVVFRYQSIRSSSDSSRAQDKHHITYEYLPYPR
jgi:hypothetical protein